MALLNPNIPFTSTPILPSSEAPTKRSFLELLATLGGLGLTAAQHPIGPVALGVGEMLQGGRESAEKSAQQQALLSALPEPMRTSLAPLAQAGGLDVATINALKAEAGTPDFTSLLQPVPEAQRPVLQFGLGQKGQVQQEAYGHLQKAYGMQPLGGKQKITEPTGTLKNYLLTLYGQKAPNEYTQEEIRSAMHEWEQDKIEADNRRWAGELSKQQNFFMFGQENQRVASEREMMRNVREARSVIDRIEKQAPLVKQAYQSGAILPEGLQAAWESGKYRNPGMAYAATMLGMNGKPDPTVEKFYADIGILRARLIRPYIGGRAAVQIWNQVQEHQPNFPEDPDFTVAKLRQIKLILEQMERQLSRSVDLFKKAPEKAMLEDWISSDVMGLPENQPDIGEAPRPGEEIIE